MRLTRLPLLFVAFLGSALAQQVQGPVMTPQVNTDFYVGVGGALATYPTIQKAVTKACSLTVPGARVLIPAGATPSDNVSTVTGGCTAAFIQDQRALPLECFAWSGTSYDSTGCGEGGGSGGGFNGANYEVNAKGTGSSGVGTGLFTNAGKTLLTTQLPFTALQTNNVYNSDLAPGGLAALLPSCAGCETDIPSDSTDTYQPSQLMGTTQETFIAHDNRPNLPWDYYNNVGDQTEGDIFNGFFAARPRTCSYGEMPNGSTNATYGCFGIYGSKYGPGISVDDTWSTMSVNPITYNFYTRGQSFINNDTVFFGKDGDSIWDELNQGYRGGCTGFSDECNETTSHHLIEMPAPFGTVASGGGVGSTDVVLTLNDNHFLGDGLFLVFPDEVFDTTTIVSCTAGTGTNPDLCVTGTTHAQSPYQATMTASCGVNVRSSEPLPAACAVSETVTTTPPTVGQSVCVADSTKYEQAKVAAISAGSITLNLRYSHATGVNILFGGTCGGANVFGNGIADPATANIQAMIPYPNAGSPDSTHILLPVTLLEGEIAQPLPGLPSQHVTTLGSSDFVSCSGAGLVTTTDTLDNFYNNWTPPGGASIQFSGNDSGPMNGTITNVVTDSTGSSWTAPGGSCGGSGGGNGGTIKIVGNQNSVEYCAVETTAIPTGNLDSTSDPNPTGEVNTEPGRCAMTAGERVVQSNHYSTRVSPYNDEDLATTPGSAGHWETLLIGGEGYSGASLFQIDTLNAITSWYGNGGDIDGMTLFDLQMPYDALFTGPLPMNGHPFINLECEAFGPCNKYTTPLISALNGSFSINASLDRFEFNEIPVFFSAGVSSAEFEVPNVGGAYSWLYSDSSLVKEGYCSQFRTPALCLGENYNSNGSSGYAPDGVVYEGSTNDTLSSQSPNISAGYGLPDRLISTVPSNAGTTGYGYYLTGITAAGTQTPLSLDQFELNSATLGGSNTITITCPTSLQFGYVSGMAYHVWRTLLGSGSYTDLGLCALGSTVVDDGSNVAVNTPPATNYTGVGGAESWTVGGSPVCTTAAPCGGTPPAPATVAPLQDGTAAVGTSVLYARQDHVHPTDTTRAPLASPSFTGVPLSTTPSVNDSSTKVATTAYVIGQAATAAPVADGTAAVGVSNLYARQDHVHPTDTTRAPLASPTFTGIPAAPTAGASTNTTQLATTGFVKSVVGISGNVTSATGGTGITAVTCSTASCTNLRGTYTMTATAITAGVDVTLVWPTTTTAYACTASQNGGATYLGVSHSVATATGMTISSAETTAFTGTLVVDYSCEP
jgi:hypothetical protein